MAELLSKKTWRLRDVLFNEGTEQVVRVLKIDHPFRRQRITIVPTPRYAREAYLTDWVYQPYVKEHIMYVSNDIYNPFYVFLCRSLLRKGKFPEYAYFHPMGLPDCVDVNLSRRAFIKKEQPFKTPMSTILMTTNHFRDSHHPWVSRRTVNIVGEQYVVHPKEDKQSMVFVLPPAYVPDVVNTLQGLGFAVADTVTASIGDAAIINKLNSWSDKCQLLVLGYLWFLLALFIIGESRHIRQLFQDYKRELIEKAGKDPAKMGL
ncbi:hypothetical protein conserved [Leishmania donovani]|uniref:Hypothetical_protein_conserved n=1 Tax=Leishmania donovani TaxID=5661 RepID=A0A3Q8ICJ6_LEIDO|nr:hypothetical protein LdCL_250031200 [Leishmania donovani]TPP48797.1 hypothetical protein CGC20_26080 [Leishmania donovani]CAJ1989581.1 hypothetical protein conserved [Leishmania donovani]VDZ45447.1 hypothetical_protein_conserved [Leishmania donovani]